MPFDPTLAAIRFGMGLSPNIAPPNSAGDMLARLSGPDDVAALVPIPTFATATPSSADFRTAIIAVNQARGTDGETAAEDAQAALREEARLAVAATITAECARATHTKDGFRERLTRFWSDHFTVRAVTGLTRHLVSPHVEEFIRPHVAGSFGDMLVAAVQSPMMVHYLDQQRSMGPNSRAARSNNRGLNENLARELLELHTLGVGGGYTQTDVRELAELLTGVTANAQRGGYFRRQQAEPGPETVLGVTYGGTEESIDHVIAALRDIAVHPNTAQHLARKLVVHFIAPDPDSALVDAMAQAYLDADGQLMPMYDVMLASDVAWVSQLQKVKQPFDFVASSMRALAVPLDVFQDATLQEVRRVIQRPLSVMGQVWQNPVGPDGWPEDEHSWVTPQGMAGRITWAMEAPRELIFDLPDPRDFVYHALGPAPPDAVIFAANAAETIKDGIGIVLASAAFQRR